MVNYVITEGTVHAKAADWLFAALEESDEDVVLASPYLSYVVARDLAEVAERSNVAWRLYTRLDPMAAAGGFLSAEGLRKLIGAGVSVRHVERLHAKAFLVGRRGFLGSANLTSAGLGNAEASNDELGAELMPAQVESVRQAMGAWTSSEVTAHHLAEFHQQVRRLVRPIGTVRDDQAGFGPAIVEQLLLDIRDPGRRLLLKQEYGEPSLEQWRSAWFFGSPKKSEPRIKPGDLVLICAKQTKDCYVVVEVTSVPEYLPTDYADQRGDEAERWPWVNRTKPRLVPSRVLHFKPGDMGRSSQGLQNGHIVLSIEQFAEAVNALSRIPTT
ncbi:hypothetical protein ARUE_c17600 [Arthrobacter sp. Rue61a]|nr:hypothetical protein ARUE_c17600 [Arthrobacter sp. Rue61a]